MSGRTRNVSVQVLPLTDEALPVVDRAIRVIQDSGIRHEVGPLETTMEGEDLDELLEVAKAAHRACFEGGAEKVVTFIKIADSVEGTSIEAKTAPYRGGKLQ
ncbi:MAG: MTH1187 family thiamine-binding protein [Spirochaetaceae bacterium]